jgi:hypothetical protein
VDKVQILSCRWYISEHAQNTAGGERSEHATGLLTGGPPAVFDKTAWRLLVDLVIGLLIFNLGSLLTIGMMLAQIQSNHNHLKEQFRSLAGDFKAHIKK